MKLLGNVEKSFMLRYCSFLLMFIQRSCLPSLFLSHTYLSVLFLENSPVVMQNNVVLGSL